MSNTAPLSKPFNHDLPTLLRLIAITLIVAGHFDLFKYGGGGAALLMVIVGYNIATFKLPKVLESGSVKPIAIMIIKVMIPTIAYTLLLHLVFGPFRYQELLLISNFYTEHHPNGFHYWFIEVYIQVQIMLLALLALQPVRSLLINHKKTASYGFVLLATLLYLITDNLWDFSSLYRRLPWLMLWLVAFGFAARCADSLPEKIILSLSFIIVSTSYYGSIHWFLATLVTLLIFNPPLSLPALLKIPVNYIAAGSLFIYLTHFQVRTIFEKVVQDTPIAYTLAALFIGATLFHIYNKLINKPAIIHINNIKIQNKKAID
ncbi:MAG: acyltransferase family protein [Nitrincola lacisaponensis]|uniref:acyltransferase family protein n=1 Tax=Nitrincola lacisaponensis TaxID=267850 RepID=UPI00391AA142